MDPKVLRCDAEGFKKLIRSRVFIPSLTWHSNSWKNLGRYLSNFESLAWGSQKQSVWLWVTLTIQ